MTRTILIAAALALAVTLPPMPAQAGAGRTFVSAAGNDSDPCTITLPCRNFEPAYMQTNANGQIDALDPGNYGALTITGPVSIQGHGWASMSANTGAAITINANTSDKINIVGVVLDGLGIAGNTGILFNSGGNLTVRDSIIRNFSGDGIQFSPSASSQLFVSNTLVSDNGGQGIVISPSGSGTTNGVLNRVEMENNALSGLVAHSNSQAINVTVSDSVSVNNTNAGISSNSMSGELVTILVRNSTIANNGGDGLEARNIGATVSVTRSTITGNTNGWDTPSMVVGGGGGGGLLGVVSSYADNNIDGNMNDNTEPPNPLTYK